MIQNKKQLIWNLNKIKKKIITAIAIKFKKI